MSNILSILLADLFMTNFRCWILKVFFWFFLHFFYYSWSKRHWPISFFLSQFWTVETYIKRIFNFQTSFTWRLNNNFSRFSIRYAQLITYFGNFVFGFFVTCVIFCTMYNIIRLQGKTSKTKSKINKLLLNIFVNSLPKTTKKKLPKWDETITSLPEN